MKIRLAKGNEAFNRTKVLLVICLCVVAFEFGIRHAEKNQFTSKLPPRSAPKPQPQPVSLSSVDRVNAIQPITIDSDPPVVSNRLLTVTPPPTNAHLPKRLEGASHQPEYGRAIKGDGNTRR
ncbi:MAG: hypothetical protein ACK4UN_01010, partial [Limisphaerales bacterium]